MFKLTRISFATITPLVATALAVGLAVAASPAAHGLTPTESNTPGGPSTAQWKSLGKTFSFDGHSVFYVDQGTGSTTLAIHGYPTSSWDFRRLLGPMSRDTRFIAPDLLGFGFSDKPAAFTYSIASHADSVVALVKHLGVTRARLIGSDIGNAVVQELLARERASKLPFAIESVVLINGSLFAEQFKPSNAQKALLSPLGGLMNRGASEDSIVTTLTQISGPERRIPVGELSEVWKLLNYPSDARLLHKTLPSVDEREANDNRWTDALCSSNTPLKLLVGTADPTGSKAMAEALTAKCKGGRRFALQQFDKAGHFPHVEYAQETAQAILAWREGGY
ncbi:alpha/beta fold hydrolase [Acidovorax sp.]|uniref:alpha/beta fold hydrolase n=1 Tax=Acidovorax sp. TaxID=1872122 RepID=UPI00391F45AF